MTNAADQTIPNAFEIALLSRLMPLAGCASTDPAQLRVLKREITGAGSYTDFASPDSPPSGTKSHIGLDVLIEMPKVTNGLGAVLCLQGGIPTCLEIYTYGGDSWDGTFEGYVIVDAA